MKKRANRKKKTENNNTRKMYVHTKTAQNQNSTES